MVGRVVGGRDIGIKTREDLLVAGFENLSGLKADDLVLFVLAKSDDCPQIS